MAEVFDRSARLEILDLANPFGLRIEFARDLGLRISFEITKTNDLQPNTGSVTVWNLAENTRSNATGKIKRLVERAIGLGILGAEAKPDAILTAFELNGAYLRLFAGYGLAPGQIMEGTSQTSESTRRSVDWRTDFSFGDGELGLRSGVVLQTFGPGTPFQTVIEFLISSLGVRFDPAQLALAFGTPASRITTGFPKGVTLTGSARKNLESFLAFIEVNASIQDGQFQILRFDQTTLDPPILLSLTNGLLEQPRELEAGAYEVVLNMASELSPGRPCLIESDVVTGAFRVEQVTHRGDTHGGQWHTTAEIRDTFPVPGL